MSVMFIETVRLDADTKNHFLTLKRRTGVENWNVLARWSLCISLSDPTPLRNMPVKGSGAIEMTWKTFGGDADQVYWALLVERCRTDNVELTRDNLSETLRQHIARGASRLVGNRQMKSISDLITLALSASQALPAHNP